MLKELVPILPVFLMTLIIFVLILSAFAVMSEVMLLIIAGSTLVFSIATALLLMFIMFVEILSEYVAMFEVSIVNILAITSVFALI